MAGASWMYPVLPCQYPSLAGNHIHKCTHPHTCTFSSACLRQATRGPQWVPEIEDQRHDTATHASTHTETLKTGICSCPHSTPEGITHTYEKHTHKKHFLRHATSTWVKESFISAWLPLGRLALLRTHTLFHSSTCYPFPLRGPPLALHNHIHKHKHSLATNKCRCIFTRHLITMSQCIYDSNKFITVQKTLVHQEPPPSDLNGALQNTSL